MAATEEQKARLRRMVGEAGSPAYSDSDLASYIERYPMVDGFGRDPFRVATAVPPALEANPDWTGGYDLNAAASTVWTEKAGSLAAKFDFNTDGQSFSRSQMYKHAMQQSKFYAARRSPTTITLTPSPLRNPSLDDLRFQAIDI